MLNKSLLGFLLLQWSRRGKGQVLLCSSGWISVISPPWTLTSPLLKGLGARLQDLEYSASYKTRLSSGEHNARQPVQVASRSWMWLSSWCCLPQWERSHQSKWALSQRNHLCSLNQCPRGVQTSLIFFFNTPSVFTVIFLLSRKPDTSSNYTGSNGGVHGNFKWISVLIGDTFVEISSDRCCMLCGISSSLCSLPHVKQWTPSPRLFPVILSPDTSVGGGEGGKSGEGRGGGGNPYSIIKTK